MPEDRFKYVKAPGVLEIEKMRADGLYPTEARISQGPVAVIECVEEIPCNPCEKACQKGCIRIGDEITTIPEFDERCTGCGLCVASCPGLCIFILSGAYSDNEATVTMPYELLPLPENGEKVDALDRTGKPVCEGTIVSIRKTNKQETCNCLTVAIPKRYIHDVRHIERRSQ